MFCMFLRNLYKGSQTRSFHQLFRQTFVAILLSATFYSHALTVKTSNVIQGNAPYLTFDAGRTRALNIEALLGITLSNGEQYTTKTNTSSSSKPIELPVAGQSFADIDMIFPTNVDLITLKTLIGPPNNYWWDDDGDGEINVNGFLELSLLDERNRTVSRNTVLRPCNAPYEVILTSTNGRLTTRYGFPNSSDFNPSRVTYFVKPKGQEICFASPSLSFEGIGGVKAGPPEIFDPSRGFLPQSTDSYGKNFPTTAANNMYFDLKIAGNSQALSWGSVSRGGITATMTNSTATSVRVTLTGPVATESQWNSSNPGLIAKPTLPQTFELVGRDSNGKAIVKYGFTLKQWFVNRGKSYYTYPNMESWCNSIGYRLPRVKDLTNAKRYEITGATPSSSGDYYMRTIGAGFIAEWGNIGKYDRTNFDAVRWYWTSDVIGHNRFIVHPEDGHIHWAWTDPAITSVGLCTLP